MKHRDQAKRATPSTLTMIASAGGAFALMVLALLAWNRALEMSAAASRPEVAGWAFRSGAVAAAAAAHLVLLSYVIPLRSRRPAGGLVRIGIGLVGSIALVSAVALGLAGK